MDNLRAALQALIIAVVVVLVLIALWNLAPHLVRVVQAGRG